MTILYNTETQNILGYFTPRYLIDGISPNLETPIIELNYIKTIPPQYDELTQKIVEYWEISENDYIQNWTILNKTAEELEAERIAAIPEEISKRQLKIALLTQLNIEGPQIDIMISQIPDETQRKITEIEWKDGAFVKRTHPMVNLFAEQLGLSQRQLDDLFTFAKDI